MLSRPTVRLYCYEHLSAYINLRTVQFAPDLLISSQYCVNIHSHSGL